MLKGKDKKIVIDYLYNQFMEGMDTEFYIKNKIMAMNKSVFQYECMTIDQRIDIHRMAVRLEMQKYLIESSMDALIGECVHGNLDRKQRWMRSWSKERVKSLTPEEEKDFFEKLGYTYF